MGVGVCCNILLDTVVNGHHIVADYLVEDVRAINILADVVP